MFLTCVRVFVVTILLATVAFADTSWTECKLCQATVATWPSPSAPPSVDCFFTSLATR